MGAMKNDQIYKSILELRNIGANHQESAFCYLQCPVSYLSSTTCCSMFTQSCVPASIYKVNHLFDSLTRLINLIYVNQESNLCHSNYCIILFLFATTIVSPLEFQSGGLSFIFCYQIKNLTRMLKHIIVVKILCWCYWVLGYWYLLGVVSKFFVS